MNGDRSTPSGGPAGEERMHKLREERLVREGLPLLRAEAERLWRRMSRRVELEELQGLGHVALIELARDYDPSRGPFAPFATLRLRWAILDGIRRHSHGRVAAAQAKAVAASERLSEGEGEREPVEAEPTDADEPAAALRALLRSHAGALAVALVAACGDMAGAPDPGEDPEQAVLRAARAATLRQEVVRLPAEQRTLIERHYFEDERFDHIAADLGISKSWASRLHAQAMAALAAVLRGQGCAGEHDPCGIQRETSTAHPRTGPLPDP